VQRVFIGVSSYMCMSIYVYTVFLKKQLENILGITFLNTNVLSPNCANKFYNVRIRNSGRN
jgi:hypothetical protein